MKVYKSFEELAVGINKKSYEVEEAWHKWIGRGYMYVDDIEVNKQIKDNEMHFIIFDHEDDEDCKKYIMEYEKCNYNWRVYVDDIGGWQECKVIDIKNTRLGVYRATVITQSGTQLNRKVRFVLDKDEIKKDRCIYFFEKDELE